MTKQQIIKSQLEVGVILVDKFGRARKIVAQRGSKFQLSHKHEFEIKGKWWTADEILSMGDKIVYRP